MKKTVIELKRALESALNEVAEFSRSIDEKTVTEAQMTELEGKQRGITFLETQIGAAERAEKIALGQAEAERKTTEPTEAETRSADAEIQKKVFGVFLRGGSLDSLNTKERSAYREALQRGQVIGTDSKGGFLTPEYFSSQIITSLKNSSGALELVNVIYTSNGNPFNMPKHSDINNIAVPIGEAVQVTQDELVFGRVTLGAHKFTSLMFKVSSELVQDSIVDIEAVVMDSIAMRFKRALNRQLTLGSNPLTTPVGFASQIIANTYQKTTLAINTAVSYDELVNIKAQLDADYFKGGNVHWTFSSLTEAAIMKLKDTTGQPIWSRGDITKAQPSTLLGVPIVINNDMENLGAANKCVIAIGDFKAGYTARIVTGVAMNKSNDLFMETDELAYVGFMRFDGQVTDDNAVKLFITP